MEKLSTKILESLKNQITVINNRGVIIYTNRVRVTGIDKNSIPLDIEKLAVGENYLTKGLQSSSISKKEKKALNGINSVLSGEVEEFVLDFSVSENRCYTLSASSLNNKGDVVLVLEEVIRNKERETELLESTERLRVATLYAKSGVWDWDVKNNILIWDDSMYTLYDVNKSDFSGGFDAWEKTLHEDDLAAANREVEKALTGEKELNTVFRIKSASGEVKYIQAKGNVTFNSKNEAVRMLGVNYDVTEKEKIQFEMHNAIIKTEEAERQRISHDLHDGLGQTIAAANMFMNTMDLFAREQFDKEAMAVFNAGKKLIKKAAKETRMVSYNITPRSLKTFGLEEALTQLLQNYQQINEKFKIIIDSNLKGFRFQEEAELAIFRALQEAINNAMKHSGASEIKCELKTNENKLSVSIIDNGDGFDLEEVSKLKKGGIGLISLSQRIKMIGGKLEIKSSKGKGTTVNIVVSLSGT
jgi:signal transduction histidine kinase